MYRGPVADNGRRHLTVAEYVEEVAWWTPRGMRTVEGEAEEKRPRGIALVESVDKLDQMRLHGMARALRTSLQTQGQWTADELLAHLVDA